MANNTEPIFDPITKELSNVSEKVEHSNEFKQQSNNSQFQTGNNYPLNRENPFTVDENVICRR